MRDDKKNLFGKLGELYKKTSPTYQLYQFVKSKRSSQLMEGVVSKIFRSSNIKYMDISQTCGFQGVMHHLKGVLQSNKSRKLTTESNNSIFNIVNQYVPTLVHTLADRHEKGKVELYCATALATFFSMHFYMAAIVMDKQKTQGMESLKKDQLTHFNNFPGSDGTNAVDLGNKEFVLAPNIKNVYDFKFDPCFTDDIGNFTWQRTDETYPEGDHIIMDGPKEIFFPNGGYGAITRALTCDYHALDGELDHYDIEYGDTRIRLILGWGKAPSLHGDDSAGAIDIVNNTLGIAGWTLAALKTFEQKDSGFLQSHGIDVKKFINYEKRIAYFVRNGGLLSRNVIKDGMSTLRDLQELIDPSIRKIE